MMKTIFLDRDGVINRKMGEGEYVRKFSEFEFLDGALDAMRLLAARFDRIIVVSNQQGVYKGMMTGDEVESIHARMVARIESHGGRVDAVYYCPHGAAVSCGCRKPDIGMALRAREDFPEICFEESVMVGDSESDMEFGRRIGARTFLITENFSLLDFAKQA